MILLYMYTCIPKVAVLTCSTIATIVFPSISSRRYLLLRFVGVPTPLLDTIIGIWVILGLYWGYIGHNGYMGYIGFVEYRV